MNNSCIYRQQNIPEEIIGIDCSAFENSNNTPSYSIGSHLRRRRRGKNININITTAVPVVRSFLLFLLLVTTCMLSSSSAMVIRTAASTTRRRSARLRGVQAAVAANAPLSSLSSSLSLSSSSSSLPSSDPTPQAASKKRQRRTRSTSSSDTTAAAAVKKEKETKRTKAATKSDKPKTKIATKKTARKKRKSKQISSDSTTSSTTSEIWCLPRTQEKSILSSSTTTTDNNNNNSIIRFVMGIDEAGRGPLAGPVVAAAAIVPLDIDGITDSKKITKEQDREDLYEAITSSPNVRWAVAVMDAPFIDKVNILQATMRAMAAAASALTSPSLSVISLGELKIPIVPTLTIEQKGSYVITNNNGDKDNGTTSATTAAENYCALVDGNRCPPDMPCESHSIVKGDSKEYAIAAASILAKVSRDRLMRDYHELYPHFGLNQHKGYPTAAHMKAVKTFGASPIHRRTFRPLKDMTFDKDGKIVK